MNKISVVIRNKNQRDALDFLLKNLSERYQNDIDEIIVLDNLSNDDSEEICKMYGVKFIQIKKFSYGSSANLAAEYASNKIIVIFSAHAYPVSHDFFKLISEKFDQNNNLAGLRCLHNKNDYKNYINQVSSKDDPNISGLIFCGSAFSKKVWELHKFKDDITTMEDKEWSVRVLKEGYDIEFCSSIFCYDIVRSHKQNFLRFKNETIGSYQLWGVNYTYKTVFKGLFAKIFKIFRLFFIEIYYAFRRFFFLLKFLSNRPDRF